MTTTGRSRSAATSSRRPRGARPRPAGARRGRSAGERALREPPAELVDPAVVLVEAGRRRVGALEEGGQEQGGHPGEPGRDDAVVHQVGEVGRAGGRDKWRHRPASFPPVGGNRQHPARGYCPAASRPSVSLRSPARRATCRDLLRVEWNRLNFRDVDQMYVHAGCSSRVHTEEITTHEPVRGREVHHPQPRGDRGRPAVRDHRGQHRTPSRSTSSSRCSARPTGPPATWSTKAGVDADALDRAGRAGDGGAAARQRRDRPAARRLGRADPGARGRARPRRRR